jgi:hypothetical protein
MISLEEPCVNAALGDQLRMATLFNDPPRAEDQDPVRVAHRGQTVRDDQAGPAPQQDCQRGLDLLFGLAVDAGGRLRS